MNKLLFFSVLLLFAGNSVLNAQYNFVLQNGNAKVFKTINEAYDAAVPGDTIYLPGGSFNWPANVSKGLVWIGVGYHPDSTVATYFTRINNAVTFTLDADLTVLMGIHFISNVSFNSLDADVVDDFVIHRCRIGGSLYFKRNDNQEHLLNSLVSECVIDGTLYAYNGSNIRVENSIIRGTLNNFRGSYFDQNIFTLGSRSTGSGVSFLLSGCEGCLLRNSIINYYSYINWRLEQFNNANNSVLNCVFAGNITFPDGINTGSDNITGIDLSSVFENIDGNLPDFSYAHNFRLKAGSPAIGAGLNGHDAGIYSGSNPFKEGGLPPVPHIRSVNIDNETSNGLIKVEIGVGAQDR
jgi:hypothetical protein